VQPSVSTYVHVFEITRGFLGILYASYCVYAKLKCLWLLALLLVHTSAINQFKARLDKFWLHQDILYDYTADLTELEIDQYM